MDRKFSKILKMPCSPALQPQKFAPSAKFSRLAPPTNFGRKLLKYPRDSRLAPTKKQGHFGEIVNTTK
jgi:hypothetical protein